MNASYGVHPDMKIHTGGTISLGRGMIYNKSSKQKLNSKSFIEAELVAASEVLTQILWTRYFLIEQGYDVQKIKYSKITRARSKWREIVGCQVVRGPTILTSCISS